MRIFFKFRIASLNYLSNAGVESIVRSRAMIGRSVKHQTVRRRARASKGLPVQQTLRPPFSSVLIFIQEILYAHSRHIGLSTRRVMFQCKARLQSNRHGSDRTKWSDNFLVSRAARVANLIFVKSNVPHAQARVLHIRSMEKNRNLRPLIYPRPMYK